MKETFTAILNRVYKKLEEKAVISKRFKLGITCHMEYVSTEPDYTYAEPLFKSSNKELIEKLAKYLREYSIKLFENKCVNKEIIKIDDVTEKITGMYTIYVVYKI